MAQRFLRENSQIISSVFITSIVGTAVLFKINKSLFSKEYVEFKTINKNLMNISAEEEKPLRKFLYRLNHQGDFDFFRAGTVDFVSFGFNKLRQGCEIGVPVSFFAKNKDELLELSPPNGFIDYLGKTFKYNDIEKKLGSDKLNEFYESMLLSDDAKLFALGHAVTESNHALASLAENIVDLLSFSIGYSICYSQSRKYKLQLAQRKILYLIAIIIGLSFSMMGRFYFKIFNDKLNEKNTCKLGLDCAEGSLEFYNKMLNRNIILRNVIDQGTQLIDENGNYLKKLIRIPFTNYQFYIKNFDMSINDRKIICEKELFEIISKSNKESESNESKVNEDVNPITQNEDRELKFFKNIRLKLESIKMEKYK